MHSDFPMQARRGCCPTTRWNGTGRGAGVYLQASVRLKKAIELGLSFFLIYL